ncbi:hypothetical protein EAE96_008540 [Botrytis aclada]|nr:hypothetical protein EAE96_008540 [Botrytis aclada]
MSRQSNANHNSRPVSINQFANQRLSTSHSQESNDESITGISDSHRSSNGHGRVRESRNISGKYLPSRGRQGRRDDEEIARSCQENEPRSAENRRKALEGRHRDDETRRRERLERVLEEKDKVRKEERAQEIERTGGWYQHDQEKKEKQRQQRDVSKRIATLPPRQRLQEERRIAKRQEEERIHEETSRRQEIARELYKLKREDDIQKENELWGNYACREGERLGEESQLLRLDSAWERGFDVRRVDVRKWVLGPTYQPYDYRVVPFYSRVGIRPSIPLPRQWPSGAQVHRPALPSPTPLPPQVHRPAPPPSPSLSAQPPQPLHPPFPPQSLSPPSRRPGPPPHYNTNPLPRANPEHIPPPCRSHYHHNPVLPKSRSSDHGRSPRSIPNHTFTASSLSKHNKNQSSSTNKPNPPNTKAHSTPASASASKNKKFLSRTSRIKTSGRARVKDCIEAGAAVRKAGAAVGRVVWEVVGLTALVIAD